MRAASKALLDAGIPGHRYVGNESGSTNYVIYDDSRVQVKSFEQGGDNPRGAIQLGDTGSVISLFKTADASTALHESGHLFLSMFKSMAEAPGAPIEMQRDLQLVKDWWASHADEVAADSPADGVTGDDVVAVLRDGTSGDKVKDLAINVGLQEQWARGFEAYLREGAAPSQGLAGLFEQFKRWLQAVYKAAADLKVDISPEWRGVFDRLLSTDRAKSTTETRPTVNDTPTLDFSAPAPHPVPEGVAEAGARVARAPDAARDLEEQFGVSEDGSFPEMDTIAMLDEMGELTPTEKAVFAALDQEYKNATAWGDALMTAARCAFR